MISVVIPAHNEASVIGRLLDRLDSRALAGDLDVVVVANGCVDDTANVAKRHHVRVVELPEGSKTAALRAGDSVAASWPRFYVDADIEITGDDLLALASTLSESCPATAPSLRLDISESSRLVASYHRIWIALPSVQRSLAGRGCFGMTEDGRSRWGEWPDLTADDQFANQMFDDHEKAIHSDVFTVVRPPSTIRGLINRKRRSHRGNTDLEAGRGAAVTSSTAWIGAVRRNLRLLPDAPVYLVITLWVRALSRRDSRRNDSAWRSDDSRGKTRHDH